MRFVLLLLAVSMSWLGCDESARNFPSAIVIDAPSPPATSQISNASARQAYTNEALRRRIRFWSEIDPSYLSRLTQEMTDEALIREGAVSAETLIEIGRLIFEHEFTPQEGMSTTIQRINGPDSNTCTSCHWKGGPGGAGGLTDNTLVSGEDDRVYSADSFNPPSLEGVGIVQMLASEMSADLAVIRDEVVALAQTSQRPQTAALETKGVNFGTLTANPDGSIDTSEVEGLDPDLVVKPFRWKGTSHDLMSFVRESVDEHMRMNEVDLSVGQRLALTLFLASRKPPEFGSSIGIDDITRAFDGSAPTAVSIYEDEWAEGQQLFSTIGCAGCHAPKLSLSSTVFEALLGDSGASVRIDFAKLWGLEFDDASGKYWVRIFSDLKRHNLGESNASKHYFDGVRPSDFITRRLWDVADTAPYMHDGRAAWFTHAIRAHGGEAQASRGAYELLGPEQQAALRVFLMSLRRAPRPLIR